MKKLKKMINSVFAIRKIINEDSYYQEKKRKSKIKRWLDNFHWLLDNHDVNVYYNLYGLDIVGNDNQKIYLSNMKFMKERNQKNRLNEEYSYVAILRDKILFEKYMVAYHIPTIKNIASIFNGEFYDENLIKINDVKEIFDKTINGLFVKPVADECGNGIYYIKDFFEYKKTKGKICSGSYIVQEQLIQHDDMKILNPNSINTLRIVTICQNIDNISVFGILLRIGTKKSGYVDNSSRGGIVVPISIDGKVNKYGFSKPEFGGKIKCHPDSKIVFSEFKIPYFQEAIELVKNAHRTLYNIHSIGWDVAITPKGPILIEGNDNWEIQSLQSTGGLKSKWNKYLL